MSVSAPQISVILPTLNEAANLPLVVPRIVEALVGRNIEILIIDDASRDTTPQVCAQLAAQYPLTLHVRTQPKDGLSGAVLYGINYLALRQAITPDRLLGRMTATMRFFTVASAPLGSLVGGALATAIGLRGTLLTVGVLGLVLSGAAVMWSPDDCRRLRRLIQTLTRYA